MMFEESPQTSREGLICHPNNTHTHTHTHTQQNKKKRKKRTVSRTFSINASQKKQLNEIAKSNWSQSWNDWFNDETEFMKLTQHLWWWRLMQFMFRIKSPSIECNWWSKFHLHICPKWKFQPRRHETINYRQAKMSSCTEIARWLEQRKKKMIFG